MVAYLLIEAAAILYLVCVFQPTFKMLMPELEKDVKQPCLMKNRQFFYAYYLLVVKRNNSF